MNTGLSKPLICPILIGREAALDSLRALLNESAASGQVALISGEAGIGKSRLLAALAEYARSQGIFVLGARCVERDAGVPYSAVISFMDVLREARPESKELIERLAGSFKAGAPEPDADQRREAGVLTSVLSGLVSEQPLLLSVEDLHWGDEASFDSLLALARKRLPGLTLVLTYRDDELPASLRAMLAQLDRERLSSEVRLSRLDLAQVDRMIRTILETGSSTRAGLLHAVFQLTGGNPFFVEEVLRSCLDRAGSLQALADVRTEAIDVPRSVNEALGRRTSTLSAEARELLSTAAVAGVHFDFALLHAVTGRDEEALLARIKELIAAQLVTEEEEDSFAFRHALTRQAVLAGMLARERRAISRRIAHALRTLVGEHAEARVEELARHFYEAGEWETALRYLVQAGERALRLYAPAAALEHLTHAIEAAEKAEGASTARTFRLRGSAHDGLGNFDLARMDYERAIAEAGKAGDERTRWEALLDLGLLWASRDYSRTGDYYRQAVDLARGFADPVALALSLNRLGNWHLNTGHPGTGANLHVEALDLFREAGDQAGEAATLDLLGMTAMIGGDLAESAVYLKQAITALEAVGDRRVLANALASIAVTSGTYQTQMFAAAITLPEAAAYGERAVAVAANSGSRSTEAYARWQLAFALGPSGEQQRALELAGEALAIAREIGHTQWAAAAECALGAIYLDILALPEALGHLEEALRLAREMNSDLWLQQAAALLAAAYIAANRTGDAASLYASVAMAEPQDIRGFNQRIYHAGAAEIALAGGDYEAALDIARSIDRLNREHDKNATSARLLQLIGQGQAAMGQAGEALRSFEEALGAARAQGAASVEWRIEADRARVRLASGDRDAAREHAARATTIIDRIASRLAEDRLRANFLDRAQELLPPALRRRGGRDGHDGLTARESEIAALIARGLTNRDIAERLVLSARTVETHVANAMSKMGFGSRAQLAAWAVERGLTSET